MCVMKKKTQVHMHQVHKVTMRAVTTSPTFWKLPPFQKTNPSMADEVVSAVTEHAERLMGIRSVCDAQTMYSDFVNDLTVGIQGVDYERITEDALAANTASGVIIAIGLALVCAPIIFGRQWLRPVLVLIALLVGAIASGMVLRDGRMFEDGLKAVGVPEGNVTCGMLLLVQLLASVALALFVNRLAAVAFFAIGAAAAGFLAYVGLGLLEELLRGLPFVPSDIRSFVKNLGDTETYVMVGAAAVAGGLLFGRFQEGLVDATLGLLGSVLIALGVLSILTMDVLSRESIRAYRMDDLYMAYVVGLVVLIEVLRHFLVKVRMGDYLPAVDQMPGGTLKARAAAVASKSAKTAPAGGSSPTSSKMAAKSKNSKGGKGMY
jgi:hypothetical protein